MDDDEFGMDALGLHATNEERMDIVVMRMPPDQQESYRRLAFDLGIMPSDIRWQFIEYITRYGPEAADAMMREIGRVNYHFSESEIDEWQARVNAQVETMRSVLSLDAGFNDEAAQVSQKVVKRGFWARLRCFIHLSNKGALS